MQKILNDIRVLDLSIEASGAYAGRLFAQYGAEVLKVEPPDGDPLRSWGPFPNDQPHPEKSGLFLYLNAHKRGITLNLEKIEGRELLLRLVDGADILIESFPPGAMDSWGVGREVLHAQSPHLVVTSISPFGQDGPYRDYQLSDLLAWAASSSSVHVGVKGKQPLAIGANVSYYATGALATVAALGALYGEERGQWADVSLMDGMIQMFAIGGIHQGGRQRPSGSDPLQQPIPCKDGYAAINPLSPQHWPMFCVMAGMVDLVEHPDFRTGNGRIANAEALAERVRPWFAERTREEIFQLCGEFKLPGAYITTAPDILTLKVHQARHFLVDMEVPGHEPIKVPGVPMRFADIAHEQPHPAPRLGEHNGAVYGALGYVATDLARLKREGVI